ncbi:MAG: hypothetical protein HYV07_11045 [Deltaproteobacteria bacterium]|nr:hypothetical protein [Deltaproteobacteria bacterium]
MRAGRFASPDAFVFDPASSQALNRYAYVLNNPVTLVDPSGHCGEPAPCEGVLCIVEALFCSAADPSEPEYDPWDVNAAPPQKKRPRDPPSNAAPRRGDLDPPKPAADPRGNQGSPVILLGVASGSSRWSRVANSLLESVSLDQETQDEIAELLPFDLSSLESIARGLGIHGVPQTPESRRQQERIQTGAPRTLVDVGSTLAAGGALVKGALALGADVGVAGGVAPTLFKGLGNITHAGPLKPDVALRAAQRWLGTGYKEIAPGVYRSGDALRQFRMTTSDLVGAHGKLGPHIHFEALDAQGVVLENLHVPLLP